jgi:DNA-binding NtrC family response regulator
MKTRKLNILVVDDEDMVCQALRMMLKYDGHAVSTAAGGTEAWERLQREDFDLVIVDFAMPVMFGDVLVHNIRARNPTQPIIMITAHAELLHAAPSPFPQGCPVLSKPFRLETLRETIWQVIPVPGGPSPFTERA